MCLLTRFIVVIVVENQCTSCRRVSWLTRDDKISSFFYILFFFLLFCFGYFSSRGFPGDRCFVRAPLLCTRIRTDNYSSAQLRSKTRPVRSAALSRFGRDLVQRLLIGLFSRTRDMINYSGVYAFLTGRMCRRVFGRRRAKTEDTEEEKTVLFFFSLFTRTPHDHRISETVRCDDRKNRRVEFV